MNTPFHTDILIVGGGIAGPAMAAALKGSGLKTLLIERSADPADTARGDHLQPRVCEILDNWGLLPKLFAAGAEKRLGSKWFSAEGDLLHHVEMDRLDIPHPYYTFLNHELISDSLMDHAREDPNMTIWCPAKLIGLGDQTPNGNSVTIQHGDETIEVYAKLIVGADGRASRVRQSFDFESEIYGYENPLVVLFAPRLDRDTRKDLHVYITGSGVISFVPRGQDAWKIGFPIPKSDLARWRKSTQQERSDWIAERVPDKAGLQTEIAGFYQPVRMHSHHWTKDNVVLIGDAAHAMHPGQSQGMNTTIRLIDELIKDLPAPQDFSVNACAQAIESFEGRVRPIYEPLLAANHKRGLEMDNLASADLTSDLETVRATAFDPNKRKAYAMRMAGYAPVN